MKTALFFAIFVFIASTQAVAQNKIIILKRDGSREEVTLPDSEPVPDTEELIRRADEELQQTPQVPKEPEMTVEELMRQSEEPKPPQKEIVENLLFKKKKKRQFERLHQKRK